MRLVPLKVKAASRYPHTAGDRFQNPLLAVLLCHLLPTRSSECAMSELWEVLITMPRGSQQSEAHAETSSSTSPSLVSSVAQGLLVPFIKKATQLKLGLDTDPRFCVTITTSRLEEEIQGLLLMAGSVPGAYLLVIHRPSTSHPNATCKADLYVKDRSTLVPRIIRGIELETDGAAHFPNGAWYPAWGAFLRQFPRDFVELLGIIQEM